MEILHPLVQETGSLLLHRLVRQATQEEGEEKPEVFQSHKNRPKGQRPRQRIRTQQPPKEPVPVQHHEESESTFKKIEGATLDVLHNASAKSHIPFWGVLLILLVIILVIFVAVYFLLAKYWRKFKESDKGARFKGLDLKSVNLIGQLGKEKASLVVSFTLATFVP